MLIIDIRPLPAGQDALLADALALVRRVFDAFEAPGYPPEGVREFYAYLAPQPMRERLQQGALRLYTARAGGVLAGVLAMRPPAHISLLFVEAAFHRQGVARALLNAAIAALGPARPQTLTVHSSPVAAQAYRHMGFTPTGGKRTENGIRYIPMRRVLG